MNELQTTGLNKLSVQGLCVGYQHDIKMFHQWSQGRAIDVELLNDYFTCMLNNGYKAATIQRHRAALKKAITRMFGNGLTLAQRAELNQFFKEVKTPKRDQAITQDKYLNRQELKELLQASGYKTGLIIQALYETAARVSELCTIKLTDCNITGQGVIITVIGKGSVQGEFFMSTDLFNKINEAYQGTTYLFETKGGQHIKPITVSTLLKRAGQKIGIKVNPHKLRHSWASNSLESGLSLPKVSGYLRHSNLQTTLKFYVHGRASMPEIQAVNALNLAS